MPDTGSGAPWKLLPLLPMTTPPFVPTRPSWGEKGDSPGWACQGQVGGPKKPSFSSEGNRVCHLALVSKAVAVGPLGQMNVLSGHIRLCFSLPSPVLPPYFPHP